MSQKPGSPSEQVKTLQGMAMNFLACDREQPFLMPPDPRDWLPQGHLAWFLLASVEQMDLQAFYESYRSDGWGRAAFEPSMTTARTDLPTRRGVYRTAGTHPTTAPPWRSEREDEPWRGACLGRTRALTRGEASASASPGAIEHVPALGRRACVSSVAGAWVSSVDVLACA